MNESVTRVSNVLADLIKAALVSDDAQSLEYRNAAQAGQEALASEPPDAASLRVDGAWTLAIREAEKPELQPDEGRVNLTLQRESPFTLDELVSADFDVAGAVERIRQAASTG